MGAVNKLRYAFFGFFMFTCMLSNETLAFDRNAFEFSAYPVEKLYTGKLQKPDFKGRDKYFSDMRTRIVEGMKQGVIFAGEYSVIQPGCGAGCTNVYVANNRTGEVFDFPRGGEDNMEMNLEYRPDSRLMIVRWRPEGQFRDICIFESFLFEKGRWIARRAVPSRSYDEGEKCFGEVMDDLMKALN